MQKKVAFELIQVMNKTSSSSDYQAFRPGELPCTHALLKPCVLKYAENCKAASVLDIGCGDGGMIMELAASGRLVVGLDPSETGVAAARARCPDARVYCMGIYDDPGRLAESEFDMAIATEVVEHLFYPRELMRFAHKKLRGGGIFLVTTPYHGWLKNCFIAGLNRWDKHHTVLWDGGHIKFWSRATLQKLFTEEGFEVIGFEGCGRVAYLWESMVMVGRKL
jgi:2-polyprenyl-3-methyl-5-hydroxy-6-metoxy-1,4-benzoquinol methylase